MLGTLHRLHSCTQKKSFLGFTFADPHTHAPVFTDVSIDGHAAETYVAAVTHPTDVPHAVVNTATHGSALEHHDAHVADGVHAVVHTDAIHDSHDAHDIHAVENSHNVIPHNLPIDSSMIGYQTYAALTEDDSQDELSVLENQAHAYRVLLSSDAMRYFSAHITGAEERTRVLAEVLTKAKSTYPTEDGWIALNLQKMEGLLALVSHIAPVESIVETTELENSISYTPMTAGSLAEAIMLKDTALAFMLISDRPMVALADAVSDLNMVCAHKKGERVTLSNLLMEQTELLSLDMLTSVLEALSSAIDGTYSHEEEAVKMAITKAIAVLPN